MTLARVLARLSVPAEVRAHANWPADKLSGLEKLRDMGASKIACMNAVAQVCTHESLQRRRLNVGVWSFLGAHESLHALASEDSSVKKPKARKRASARILQPRRTSCVFVECKASGLVS